MKKVIATVEEEYTEPTYIASYNCPYCDARGFQEIYSDNCTETVICFDCEKKYKVKIPKDSF